MVPTWTDVFSSWSSAWCTAAWKTRCTRRGTGRERSATRSWSRCRTSKVTSVMSSCPEPMCPNHVHWQFDMRLSQISKSPSSFLNMATTGGRRVWPRFSPPCGRSSASRCTGEWRLIPCVKSKSGSDVGRNLKPEPTEKRRLHLEKNGSNIYCIDNEAKETRGNQLVFTSPIGVETNRTCWHGGGGGGGNPRDTDTWLRTVSGVN